MKRARERLNAFVIIINQSENLELDKICKKMDKLKLRSKTSEAEVAMGVVIKLPR